MSTNQQHTPGAGTGGQPRSGMGEQPEMGGSPVEEARQQAREVADRVEQRAREKGEEIRGRVEQKGEEQKERAAGTAEALAEAMRAAGSTLRERQEDRLGEYTDEFAGQIERFSGYLRDRDLGGLMHDLEDMARRNPTAFLGSTLAAGLVAGRFLRSSERNSHETAHGGQGHDGDRHRPPSHREFASNSPTPELRTPREAAESSSAERDTLHNGGTTNFGGPQS